MATTITGTDVFILLKKIKERHPHILYVTTAMISDVVGIGANQVRYRCRQLFYQRRNDSEKHEGHYRFWIGEDAPIGWLQERDLLRVLRFIVQTRQRKFDV